MGRGGPGREHDHVGSRRRLERQHGPARRRLPTLRGTPRGLPGRERRGSGRVHHVRDHIHPAILNERQRHCRLTSPRPAFSSPRDRRGVSSVSGVARLLSFGPLNNSDEPVRNESRPATDATNARDATTASLPRKMHAPRQFLRIPLERSAPAEHRTGTRRVPTTIPITARSGARAVGQGSPHQRATRRPTLARARAARGRPHSHTPRHPLPSVWFLPWGGGGSQLGNSCELAQISVFLRLIV